MPLKQTRDRRHTAAALPTPGGPVARLMPPPLLLILTAANDDRNQEPPTMTPAAPAADIETRETPAAVLSWCKAPRPCC